jgi:hypothetical protein
MNAAFGIARAASTRPSSVREPSRLSSTAKASPIGAIALPMNDDARAA